MFYRNRQGLFFTFFLPVMIMLIFGLINFNQIASARLGIVDQAKSAGSKQLIETLGKIDVLNISQGDLDQEKSNLEKGDLDLVMILPANFLQPTVALSRETINSVPPTLTPTPITVYYNQSQPQNVQAGITALSQVLDQFSQNIQKSTNLFPLNQIPISSRSIKYINFLVPGVIALAIMQMGVFAIVFSLVTYREKGIMRRLLVTPLKSYDFISSIVITRVLVSFFQAVVIILIAFTLFHIKIYGNYGLLALFVLLGSIVFMALGFIVSSIAKNEDSAAPVANLIVLPMMFLGGIFFPLQSMPVWLQKYVTYLPVNYLSDSLRKVMNEGAPFSQLTRDFWGLIVWAIIFMVVAMITFRRSMREA